MEEAINKLHEKGHVVRTTVFADPGRGKNKAWASFFQSDNLRFQPVKRNPGHMGEANDEAIASMCRRLVRSRQARCIAVLASDGGFLDVLKQAKECGMKVFLCTPASNLTAVREATCFPKFGRIGRFL